MADFKAECEEIVQRVTTNLGLLEKGDRDPERLDELYRDMHTMKGSAQLFGFKRIGQIAHVMEASLDPVRKNPNRVVHSALIDAAYVGLDLIERILATLEKGGTEESFEQDLKHVLPKLIEAGSLNFGGELELLKEIELPLELMQKEVLLGGKPVEKVSTQAAPQPIPTQEKVPAVENRSQPSPKEKTMETVKEDTSKAESEASRDSTVRVSVGLLDRLMNLVGELVLVRNQVLQYLRKTEDYEFHQLSQNLDIVTSELQGEVMQTRMQPIGNVLNKFQRVVRDIARSMNKKIDLTLQGTETELDKTLLEAIKDPLTHIVRNACDHGIETPDLRIKANKPDNGHVLMRAYHEGGQVVIEISDDGKGLDSKRIKAKAVEKGLLAQDQVDEISDKETFQFIFHAGFSTAEKVSSVSGRGVGMDVVKTNIEKIGGTVEVMSELGKGTSFKLKIPLTLAIVPAMTVRCGQESYAIPQVKLVELVRAEATRKNEGTNTFEMLQGRPFYRLRGELLPLVFLHEILGIKEPEKSESINIVVLNSDGEYFGLIVDEILDTYDIVVKPLDKYLNQLTIYSGATIMGDGSIALILDVAGVASKAHIEKHELEERDVQLGVRDDEKRNSEKQEFLIFRLRAKARYSVPLCLVHRLEEFDPNHIEFSGEQRVIRYRGMILPLISVNQYLGFDDSKQNSTERIPVIVIQKGPRMVGLVVDEILDVVLLDESIDDSLRDRPGILGNIVYKNEILVVVDALGIVDASLDGAGVKSVDAGTRLSEIKLASSQLNRKRVRVLFAEDVAFFRKQVSKVLERQGYQVTVVGDGQAALDMLEKSTEGEFNLILSDIEMPRMNGFDLAKNIRSQDRFSKTPLVALTTRTKESDIKLGTQAGFNLYLEKLNAEELIAGIEKLISEGQVH